MDWYGTTRTEIRNIRQEKNIQNTVDEVNKEINLEFAITTQEINNQLILKKSYIEGTVPDLNGYSPKRVEITGANVTKLQRKATININLLNNYSSTISEVTILAKLPFAGNTYVINGKNMGSTYTTKLIEGSIKLSEGINETATIYYSEKENPTKDLTDIENGWTKVPNDWNKVKTILISMGNYTFTKGEKYDITYDISIPEGLEYNEIAYSHHAVYFSLDTKNGKYKTQVEPNKLGIRIAKQYDLEITKYHKGTEKKVQGATYYIWEDGQEEGKTRVTNIDGKLILQGLYSEKTYCVQEIKSPKEYELNNDIVKFTTKEQNEALTVQKLEGTTKRLETTKEEGQDYKVILELEDEAKANLAILKIKQKTSQT